MAYYEVNFDGIVGPTHLFSGLSFGNLASTRNRGASSSPKRAALQGLKKMELLYNLGIKQAVIPPQLRPNLEIAQAKGYSGKPHEILRQVYENDPSLFKAMLSSSSMWTANAATVSPSMDSEDSCLHLTVANLSTNLHRSLEANTTHQYLEKIFPAENFYIHPPLVSQFGDEGAANHSRLSLDYGSPGIELFVYGRSLEDQSLTEFPTRQSKEASWEIIRTHKLNSDRVVLAQQSKEAIDAGVFHNDVISTGNLGVFLYHEKAFQNTTAVIEELNSKFHKLTGKNLTLIEIKNSELSLAEAVKTYLFNSQIVCANNEMILIAAKEAEENFKTKNLIDRIIKAGDNPINSVSYVDLKESMRNGGGPACLRLRVIVSEVELSLINQRVIFTPKLLKDITEIVENYYPDTFQELDALEEGFSEKSWEAVEKIQKLVFV